MARASQPVVRGDTLIGSDGQVIALDTPAWDAWVAQALLFYVDHPAGRFAVARERRQRGDRYWLARRVDRGRRVSVYVGKTVRRADLERAGAELAERLERAPVLPPRPPMGRRVLSEAQLDRLRGEVTPEAMRREVHALLDETSDGQRRRVLQALCQVLDALWPAGYETTPTASD